MYGLSTYGHDFQENRRTKTPRWANWHNIRHIVSFPFRQIEDFLHIMALHNAKRFFHRDKLFALQLNG